MNQPVEDVALAFDFIPDLSSRLARRSRTRRALEEIASLTRQAELGLMELLAGTNTGLSAVEDARLRAGLLAELYLTRVAAQGMVRHLENHEG